MSPIITINKVPFPELTEFTYRVEPLGAFERNAAGNMVGDKIADKVKLGCVWALLKGEYLSALLDAVLPFYVDVNFTTPSGEMMTKKMYASPQSAALKYKNGSGSQNNPLEIWWSGVTVELIEV